MDYSFVYKALLCENYIILHEIYCLLPLLAFVCSINNL